MIGVDAYLRQYPETKNGGDRKSDRQNGEATSEPPERFTKDTARLGVEKAEAARAKERMAKGGPKGGAAKGKGVEFFPHPSLDTGKAREKAAAALNANAHYVSDAKKLAKTAPDVAYPNHSGRWWPPRLPTFLHIGRRITRQTCRVPLRFLSRKLPHAQRQ